MTTKQKKIYYSSSPSMRIFFTTRQHKHNTAPVFEKKDLHVEVVNNWQLHHKLRDIFIISV
jgi:hypothetical protein